MKSATTTTTTLQSFLSFFAISSSCRSHDNKNHDGGDDSVVEDLLLRLRSFRCSLRWWWWWRWTRSSPRLRFWCLTVPRLLLDLLLFLLLFLLSIAAMAPGCLRMGWFYWIASHRLTFAYGADSVRQRLDVYPACSKQQRQRTRATTAKEDIIEEPDDCNNNDDDDNKAQKAPPPAPTLLFFYGGAWLIGYKLFGCLLARTLTAAGITVVVADYRNYPLAAVPQQVDDAEAALRWTLRNVHRYGGDARNVVVGGESAGGHLILLVLLRRVLGLRRNNTNSSVVVNADSSDWNPTDLKGVIAVATPVHLASLEQVLAKHKWERHFLEAIFGGPVDEHCPHSLLLRAHGDIRSSNSRQAAGSTNNGHAATSAHHHERNGTSTTNNNSNDTALLLQDKLPPIQLYHGTHDQTVPLEGVETFFRTLRQLGADATLTVYPGWTHIHANVQGPMTGDYAFHRDVFEAVRQWTTTTTTTTESSTTATTPQSSSPTTTLPTEEQPSPSSSSSAHLEFPSHDLDLMQSFCPHILIQLGTLLMPF